MLLPSSLARKKVRIYADEEITQTTSTGSIANFPLDPLIGPPEWMLNPSSSLPHLLGPPDWMITKPNGGIYDSVKGLPPLASDLNQQAPTASTSQIESTLAAVPNTSEALKIQALFRGWHLRREVGYCSDSADCQL
jgi:hypothetical protein